MSAAPVVASAAVAGVAYSTTKAGVPSGGAVGVSALSISVVARAQALNANNTHNALCPQIARYLPVRVFIIDLDFNYTASVEAGKPGSSAVRDRPQQAQKCAGW